MPDDGAWLNAPDAPLRAASGTRTARARFEEVLAEFTQRLASPEPMRRETAVALVQQMQRLATLMSIDDDAQDGRVLDLSAALSVLNTRLDSELAAAAAREAQLTARLDRTLAELADVQAARRPMFGAGAVRLVLAAAALCAVLCGAVVGVTALNRPHVAATPAPAAVVAEPVVADDPLPSVAETAAPVMPEVREVAPAPPSIPTTRRTADTFATVTAALASGDPAAMARLRALAQAGDTRAQLQLASFYEAGRPGLSRDLAAARRWTLRAARGGDRMAMYNAAVFLTEGEGGPQDLAEAAVWFRRAADLGLTDAQYNLGVMYEAGRGVERSQEDAKRWFALAAKAGDTAAAAKLGEASTNPPSPIIAATEEPSVIETQRYLAQKGYYVGPIDGVVSSAMKDAAKAYVRDHPGSTPGV